jgi:hypothetical protein
VSAAAVLTERHAQHLRLAGGGADADLQVGLRHANHREVVRHERSDQRRGVAPAGRVGDREALPSVPRTRFRRSRAATSPDAIRRPGPRDATRSFAEFPHVGPAPASLARRGPTAHHVVPSAAFLAAAELDAEVAALDGEIAKQALAWPEVLRPISVPGVNVQTAATFMVFRDGRRAFRTKQASSATPHGPRATTRARTRATPARRQ